MLLFTRLIWRQFITNAYFAHTWSPHLLKCAPFFGYRIPMLIRTTRCHDNLSFNISTPKMNCASKQLPSELIILYILYAHKITRYTV